jgi:hypothetical protein
MRCYSWLQERRLEAGVLSIVDFLVAGRRASSSAG